MRMKDALLGVVCLSASALMVSPSFGQLYSEDFDTDHTANWIVNDSPVTDSFADIFFDYSTVGIPSAPNSGGGTTRGMQLQANLFNGVFGGFSVSPTGESFTGDYKLNFDLWSNYNGPIEFGGSGSTNLSFYGVQTSGTFSNSAGLVDSVFFANTGDAGSSWDWRAYSPDAQGSYQNGDPVYTDPTRNHTGATYQVFGGHEAPAAQLLLFPQQTGTTQLGSGGMTWHQVEIEVSGTVVTWKMDTVLLATVDTAGFTNPVGGDNILFGHGDINGSVSGDANASSLLFTLIDNVVVSQTVAVDDADFDGDNDVDGTDFVAWQLGLGILSGATKAQGDADNNGTVDAVDLGIWETQYGTGTLAAASIPEPTTYALALAALCLAMSRRRSFQDGRPVWRAKLSGCLTGVC